jgi:hypothetical protein
MRLILLLLVSLFLLAVVGSKSLDEFEDDSEHGSEHEMDLDFGEVSWNFNHV